jgi:hypothetical protein
MVNVVRWAVLAVVVVVASLLQSTAGALGATSFPECPAGMSYDDTIHCTIDVTTDTDDYTFTAAAGDRVLIRMASDVGATINPSISVLGTACASVTGALYLDLECGPLTAGVKTIHVSEYGTNATGGYTLYLNRLNPAVGATAIAYDQTKDGDIDAADRADIDFFQFTAAAGDHVLVRVARTGSSQMNPYVTTYKPDGTSAGCTTQGTTLVDLVCGPLAAGAYTIRVSDLSVDTTGAYRVYLNRSNSAVGAPAIAYDQTKSGDIDATDPADVDFYTFAAVAGDRVLIRMAAAGSTINPSISLYAPDGTYANCGSVTGGLYLDIECGSLTGGTYSVRLAEYGADHTGAYTLYVNKLNPPAGSTAIAYDQTKSADISATDPSDVDFFRFTAAAGDRILVRVVQATGSQMNPLVTIYKPDGTSAGCTTQSTTLVDLSCGPLGAGAHAIRVSDLSVDTTGAYRIYLNRLNNAVGAPTLAYDQTLSADIDATDPADVDFYKFASTAGDRVLIRMAAVGATLNPSLSLYAPDGAYTNCGSVTGGLFLDIECGPLTNGTYSIRAAEYGANQTGAYRIYVNNLNPPTGATAIAYNQTKSADIAAGDPSDVDFFTFTAAAGDRVLVRAIQASGSQMNPLVTIYEPDGTSAGCASQGTTLVDVSCGPLAAGAYTIRVSDLSVDTTGAYRLYLNRLNNAAGATTITYDQTKTADIDAADPGDVDFFTFTAGAGDRVLIRMAAVGAALNPSLALYAPDGSYTNCGSVTGGTYLDMECGPLTGGTYSLRVAEYGANQSGSYRLYVNKLNPPTGATGIAYNQTKTADIDAADPSDVDFFTFTAVAGDRILLRASQVGGSGANPLVTIYKPDGTSAGCGGQSATLVDVSCGPLTTGVYAIRVSDLSEDTTGGYRLYINRLNVAVGAPTIAYDETKTDSIDPADPADIDFYKFSATAGDRVVIRMTAVGSTINPSIALYAPDGTYTNCGSVTGGTSLEVECASLVAGMYSIRLAEYGANNIGGYTLYVNRLNPPAGATAIAYDQTKNGDIDAADPTDIDFFTFTAASGDRVFVRVAANAGSSVGPMVALYKPDGTTAGCTAQSATMVDIVCGPLQPGVNSIKVSELGSDSTGGYHVYLNRLNTAVGAAAIGYDQTKTASIDPADPTDVDFFTFSAAAGDRVILRMAAASGASVNPDVAVYGPDGAFASCSGVTGATVLELECGPFLPGTHSVRVAEYGVDDTGSYTMYVNRLNSPAGSVSMLYGETKRADIDAADPGDMDWFTFNANAGDHALVLVVAESGSVMHPSIRLYRPDGSFTGCTASTVSTLAEVTDCGPLTAGANTIRVTSYQAITSGLYKVYVRPVCTITGTTNPETINGTSGDDIICGLAGDDVINGNGGNDWIIGGSQNDTIDAGPGNDVIIEESAFGEADGITGGTGTDTMNLGFESCDLTVTLDNSANDGCAAEGDNIHSDVEMVTAGFGNDTITANSSANTLLGGDGNDMLDVNDGVAGNDTVDGGNGTDTCHRDASDTVLRCEASARMQTGRGGATGLWLRV